MASDEDEEVDEEMDESMEGEEFSDVDNIEHEAIDDNPHPEQMMGVVDSRNKRG